jgi:kynureninase
MDLATCEALDRADPLAHKRAEFFLPEGLIYLDGNSLGALPLRARDRIRELVEAEWGRDLIRSWNTHGWIDLPMRCGELIAPLVGAAPGQVICCDSISVNLFKLLAAALALQPGRHRVVAVEGDFPTDHYIAQGLQSLLGQTRCRLDPVPREALEQTLGDDVALLMLSHVDFRSGRLEDMRALTRLAHQRGVLVVWDLAHSAGVVEVALDACAADFAVGCGYKYLNGGPGAPSFLYVAARHQAASRQPLSGWMGHRAPFDFEGAYHGGEGVRRFLTGTPPVLSMGALEAALGVFEGVRVAELRTKSLSLSDLFLELMARDPALAGFRPGTPLEHGRRGSQLSWHHPDAWPICQAWAERGVIGDFRAPDILRVGLSPLYLRYQDVFRAVRTLSDIVTSGAWQAPQFQQRARVT